MGKKRRYFAILGFTTIVLLISGCGQKNKQKVESQQNSKHIYEEVREDILIDADVICPEGDFVPKVYVGKTPGFTKEQVEEFLTACNDSVVSVDVDLTDETATYYHTRTKKGYTQQLAVVKNPDYLESIFAYFNFSKTEYYDNLFIGNTRDKVMENADAVPNIEELYREPKDFSFATAAEAEAEIRKLLELLGIKEIVLEETLYLDHAIMEKYERENMELIQEMVPQMSEKDYVPKKSWTEADDCYHFLFASSVDGVSTISSTMENETLMLFPSNIVVEYNKDGIIYLSAAYPWEKTEVAETPEGIVSASAAMKVVREKLNGMYLGNDVVVEQIALRYCPVQDKDRWLLKPVWESVVIEKDVKQWAGGVSDEGFYVWVDAVTGEEM